MKETITRYFDGNYLRFYRRFFPDITKSGKEHKARCPFHEDTEPSLSINNKNGLFHCFSCKAKGDMFSFYAQKNGLNGDFPKVCKCIIDEFNIPFNSENTEGKKKKTNYEKGKIVRLYEYRDETNEKILFQKVRTDPKGFYIRRPATKNEWISGIGKITPILYRLPELIEANEVCITEGEKDVDSLKELGFIATTNFDGAGKWREEYNKYFEGKTVNIFPDNDEQGRNHAQLVASKLYGIARSVKIIELPDLRAGEDVSDFIAKFDEARSVEKRLGSSTGMVVL
jgi:DNA primase